MFRNIRPGQTPFGENLTAHPRPRGRNVTQPVPSYPKPDRASGGVSPVGQNLCNNHSLCETGVKNFSFLFSYRKKISIFYKALWKERNKC